MDHTRDKPFEPPLTVVIDGRGQPIASVEAAVSLLSGSAWPGERGASHRDALETCLKVLDGHRVVAEARQEFARAARDAGLAVSEG